MALIRRRVRGGTALQHRRVVFKYKLYAHCVPFTAYSLCTLVTPFMRNVQFALHATPDPRHRHRSQQFTQPAPIGGGGVGKKTGQSLGG